jgi:hypothetical protein
LLSISISIPIPRTWKDFVDVDASKCISPEIVHFLIDHAGKKLVFMADNRGDTPSSIACRVVRGNGRELISRLLEIGGKSWL